jgi:cyanophycinase
MASNKMTKKSLVNYIQEQVTNLYKLQTLKEQRESLKKEITLLEEGNKKKDSKYSEKAKEFISNKMSKMSGEDKSQDQKVAIAMSMARKKGLKVPEEKKTNESILSEEVKNQEKIIRTLSDNENFALIGGAETKKTLEFVINELGSNNVLVITTATSLKEDAEKKYLKNFNGLGCITDFIHASVSDDVDTKENLSKLKNADTIFFTGGDQSIITKCYLGTLFLDEMKKKVSKGTALIGTSAGAMAMSKNMITGGDETPIMGKGLSIIPDIIIDTHFKERNRNKRLEMAVSYTPKKIGLGISEDTVVIFKGKNILTFGNGKIKVF